MRALRVNRDMTIDEIDTDPEEWMADHDWDAERIDPMHDAWVLDDALFAPGLVVATIGDKPNMPLPAYITGHSGESMAAATITVEQLRLLIT